VGSGTHFGGEPGFLFRRPKRLGMGMEYLQHGWSIVGFTH